MSRLVSSLVISVAAIAGCKRTVKTAEVESWVKQRTTELGINASKVTCPKNIEAKEGKTFDCEVEVEGKTYTLVSTIKSVEGTNVKFDTAWKNQTTGVIIRSKLVPALTDELSKRFATQVAITCAEPLLFLDAARSLTCELAAGAIKSKLAITFDDKLAPTDWKLDPPLLSSAKIAETLQAAVREKTAPTVTVTCGTDPLIVRPADGVMTCDFTNGDKQAHVKANVTPDLKLTTWEVVP